MPSPFVPRRDGEKGNEGSLTPVLEQLGDLSKASGNRDKRHAHDTLEHDGREARGPASREYLLQCDSYVSREHGRAPATIVLSGNQRRGGSANE